MGQAYEDDGTYLYSIICIYKRASGKCDNFVRIKYNANECEVFGEIDKTMEEILETDIAR